MRTLTVLTAASIALFALATTANAQGMSGDKGQGMSSQDTPSHGMSQDNMKKPMMHKKMTRKQRRMMGEKEQDDVALENVTVFSAAAAGFEGAAAPPPAYRNDSAIHHAQTRTRTQLRGRKPFGRA